MQRPTSSILPAVATSLAITFGGVQSANAQLLGLLGIGATTDDQAQLIDLPSLLGPITQPLGESLTPLIDTLDTTLDPLTDPIDQQLLSPLLGGLDPLTSPLLDALDPVLMPVDGVVFDLTGGSLRDALTVDDQFNPADGDGTVNDLLGGPTDPNSGTEAGEASPLPLITGPLGDSLTPLIDALDTTLDPLTDALDSFVLDPLLMALTPVTDPLLSALEPVTDPVDGLVSDLTGGSLEDALSRIDDNVDDGNGLVNDLLGGEQDPDSGTEAGEASPLPLATSPLGQGLTPLIDALDSTLDPVTDALDSFVFDPLLLVLTPVTDPLLSTLSPVTDPVDGLVQDLTGGSLEDALSRIDTNVDDGNGLVNDLLGGDQNPDSGTEDGETTILPLTGELGDAAGDLLDALDTTLDPLTDVIDENIGEPLLAALDPVLDPVTSLIEPVTDPIDGVLSDVTGGSLEDALTNNDDNLDDGNGLVNDLLGGGSGNGGSDLDGGLDDNNNPALVGLLAATELDGACSDADADGVCDDQDRCADTPAGALVLPNGCHLDGINPLRLDGVFFEFDKATLTAESVTTLDKAVEVINASAAERLEIAGHTDSKGSDEYNQELSQRRAEAVKAYFVEHGIDAARLEARGYGEGQPTHDNSSDEGRAMNRRVELKVLD